MAITCPECGHQYDITLFEFGAVVECDYGARMKLDPGKGIALEIQDPRHEELNNEQNRTP